MKLDLTAHTRTIDLGDGGLPITLETGKMARQADGAVVVKCGDCVLLCTVVSATEERPGVNFFPLSVDYQEKFAANGRIPGSFHRREARLNTSEILVCRLVDRAFRPLFPDGYRNDTQILISLISHDVEVMPDALACLGAAAAIAVSDVPLTELISEVRIGRVNGELLINPKRSQLEECDIDIILAATEDNIMMVEGEMSEVSEEELIEAMKFGHEAIKKQLAVINQLADDCGMKGVVRELAEKEEDEELYNKIEAFITDKVLDVARGGLTKPERKAGFKACKEAVVEEFVPEEDAEEGLEKMVKDYYSKVEKKAIRRMMLDERKRLDGREMDQVRAIATEIDVLPSPHGCALFTRGETQSLTTVTLGSKDDELMNDVPHEVSFSKFFLHYNFPPFSTGETRPMRGPGRREIGHGNLAQRSLEQVLPSEDDNPYTIRIVSDILESNGSSSMATVCAGSLALMDAGVKIKSGVSGIAMGLVTDGEKFAVLSDILGDEDHLGDMDFKVTGTKNGICACQMDIKVDGLPYEVLTQALEQSKKGRLHILSLMDEVIDSAREDMKSHAPRMESVTIDGEFIGAIIGPGGKNIQELQRSTNTKVSITESEDGKFGYVTIMSSDKEGLEAAKQQVVLTATKPEVGKEYEAKVVSLKEYGAFVEFLPGKQGLLHISEVSWKRLDTVEGVLTPGDIIKIKLLDIDARSGKFKLSRKVLMPKPEGYVEPPAREERRGGGRRDDRRGGFRRDDRRGGGRRDDRRGGGGRGRDDRRRRFDDDDKDADMRYREERRTKPNTEDSFKNDTPPPPPPVDIVDDAELM